MPPKGKRPRKAPSDQDEDDGAVIATTETGRGSSSSNRGREFRVRRKQYEDTLKSRVWALRFQVADLQMRRTIWHAKLLFTKHSDTGSLAQLIRHYYSLFRLGMETPRAEMSEAARLHMRQQESFMHQLIDEDAETGETKGPVSSMNQWRLYRAAHASFMGELGSITIAGAEDTPSVVLNSKYHVRISRATFQIMFPHAANNDALVQKFLYKPVVYNCVSRFHFNREGKIDYEVVDVGIVEAFVRAGFHTNDIAELMQLSVLSPQCTIQEPAATSSSASRSGKKMSQAAGPRASAP